MSPVHGTPQRPSRTPGPAAFRGARAPLRASFKDVHASASEAFKGVRPPSKLEPLRGFGCGERKEPTGAQASLLLLQEEHSTLQQNHSALKRDYDSVRSEREELKRELIAVHKEKQEAVEALERRCTSSEARRAALASELQRVHEASRQGWHELVSAERQAEQARECERAARNAEASAREAAAELEGRCHVLEAEVSAIRESSELLESGARRPPKQFCAERLSSTGGREPSTALSRDQLGTAANTAHADASAGGSGSTRDALRHEPEPPVRGEAHAAPHADARAAGALLAAAAIAALPPPKEEVRWLGARFGFSRKIFRLEDYPYNGAPGASSSGSSSGRGAESSGRGGGSSGGSAESSVCAAPSPLAFAEEFCLKQGAPSWDASSQARASDCPPLVDALALDDGAAPLHSAVGELRPRGAGARRGAGGAASEDDAKRVASGAAEAETAHADGTLGAAGGVGEQPAQ